MLRLHFYTPASPAFESIEPAPFFRLIGSMLCRGPHNESIATYDKRWLLADGECVRAESMDPVVIYFEDNAGRASSAFGPFKEFYVVDGVAWADARVLARFDPTTQLWHPPKAQDGWASLLIAPPTTSRLDLTATPRKPTAPGR